MTRKRILYGFLILIIAVLAGGAIYLSTLLPVIASYVANEWPLGDMVPDTVVTGINKTAMEYDRLLKDILGAS